MLQKHNIFFLKCILLFLFVSPGSVAADCRLDSDYIDRGEKKVFLLCGKNIPKDYVLSGLSESHLTVEYEQYLEMCSLSTDTPGMVESPNSTQSPSDELWLSWMQTN